MFANLRLPLCAAFALLGVAFEASAVPVSCPNGPFGSNPGDYQRQATVDPALACEFGVSENPDGDTFFGGGWTNEGELAGSDGTDDYLTVTLTSGSWGSAPVEANWSIDPEFWEQWGSAVLSIHVGQGQGDPDWWAWTLPVGTLSGTFEYEILFGQGGGLSNMKLWGRDAPFIDVPEPMSIALLGLGLFVIGSLRRSVK
jgi:hypothetical protein